jgi:hypothetical protein
MTIEEARVFISNEMNVSSRPLEYSTPGTFFEWEFWGIVWTWAKGKEWFGEFLAILWDKKQGHGQSCWFIDSNLIGSPDFLIELAEFLEAK